ncbi:2'-deoxycytidine 5'-triphosphate deaminase [Maritalea porphyrae]|uniref:2'-deoxycytidine 5'-triphosphate deaminase n=1 Tax=Maritalea porphyrae TaxID=880732 RepID=UPI0022AE7EDB|nr:2'-deoxycytidine 5'-triphosphate deaminase [Maritalea porphyrae]MCZ4271600.1 2'-deoxycytidine 5'-triphosphate deaminase [Maritalea porphyrae]
MAVVTGIFSARMIADLNASGSILTSKPFDDDQVQPASLDLRLGDIAYRVRASFLPGPGKAVKDRINDLKLHQIDLSVGAVLERGCVYIVPLMESLNLPKGVSATTNPKSSTGRLDIFTRVITDQGRAFDTVPAGYQGQLYLEVSPRTFPVLVRQGSRLSQIRFREGDTRLNVAEHQALHKEQTLVFDENAPVDNGVALSIDLKGGDRGGLIGYRSKRHTAVVDVDKKAALDILDFWEPIYDRGAAELILDPDEFYILVSREAVHVPPDYAAEMVPFDHLMGEFRVHYAGFFDPGFGHANAAGAGSRAVLEVRSREVPFLVEHGQTIGRLIYERMAERPTNLYGADLNSNYQGQHLKLSKHFKAN